MSRIYGLLLEVDGPEALVAAAKAARGEGIELIDAFSPFPVEGLSEALATPATKIPLIMLGCGIFGALLAFGTMTYSAVIHYPFIVGSRPFFSWPAFVPITFELAILSAAVGGAFFLAVFSRLPRLHHPVFNDARYRQAAQAGFFLLLPDTEQARNFLTEHYSEHWQEVSQ